MGQPLTSKAFNEAVAKGGWGPKACNKQHAANLPGVVDIYSGGDFYCAHCQSDLGVHPYARCCKVSFPDVFEDDPCALRGAGADVDHGCCYHKEDRDVVDIRSSASEEPKPEVDR